MARIKGTSFGQTVAALKALPQAAERLEPRLRKYVDGREMVSVADWYPEEDQIDLLRPVVQQLGGGVGAWEQVGRTAALHDLGRVYKNLLRAGDPTATLRKMSVLWSSYHDSGRLTVTFAGTGQARLDLVDFAAPSSEMCAINNGYFRGLLESAGARDVEVVHEECIHTGDTACVWHAKWADPE